MSKVTKATKIDEVRKNPFMEPYDTPHHAIPFDRIKFEDYKPAFLEGMKKEDEEIDRIINNPEPPTFENTLVAFTETGDILERVSTALGVMLNNCTTDQFEALAQELTPLYTKHVNSIQLNTRLFERIKTVYDSHPPLKGEDKMLLEKTYEAFVDRGVGLPEEKKNHLREISKTLSLKTLQFSQNVLKERNDFFLHLTDEKDLSGLPDHQKELAAMAAKERNLKGWVITLQGPSYSPFMTYADNRKLRRKLFMAYNTLCTQPNEQNNLGLVKEIVDLHLDMAQTLGHKTYADMVLRHRMADNIKTVNRFLNKLIRTYKKPAIENLEEIRDMAIRTEGTNFKLQPWDMAYYSHKLKLEKYNIDAEMMRPYFELSKVKKGIFGLATRLYGVTFRRNTEIPVFNKDVEVYEVFDRNGSFLALLYADFFPRKDKRSGAWMSTLKDQHKKNGENIRPHASINMNLTKPTNNKPSLLTLGEVSTFLHEFGHSLHAMFSQCRFANFSGTNVYWDFVELPSQFMENYIYEKDFLRTFAYHYQTGEPLPNVLIQRAIDSKNFCAAYDCMRQVSLGLLDMAYYTTEQPIDSNIINFEKKAWKRAIIFPQRLKTCMSTQFEHIMTGGYSAGYYCYKWAEVLDADAFAMFKETGVFNQETAERFRRTILEKGATEHPKILYRKFRKRNPSINALLERDGLGSGKK